MASRMKVAWRFLVPVLLVFTLLSVVIPAARPSLVIAVKVHKHRSLIQGPSVTGGNSRSLTLPGVGPGNADSSLATLPQDFDWKAYKIFNPDFAGKLNTEADAKEHYLAHGLQQRRLYKRVPITISYTATWGLCNQLFSHLSLLAVASAFSNATLVLSPAYSRADYQGTWNFRKEPVETLLDLDKMASYWAPRGVAIKTVGGSERRALCVCVEGFVTPAQLGGLMLPALQHPAGPKQK
jgi:hypothetical protein